MDEEETMVIPKRSDGEPKRFWYDHGHVHHLQDDGNVFAWSIRCGHG